jgi:hypothetical protein
VATGLGTDDRGRSVGAGRTAACDLELDVTPWRLRFTRLPASSASADGTPLVLGEVRLRPDPPLLALLSEIRELRGLHERGLISAVEYQRRRSRVLDRI